MFRLTKSRRAVAAAGVAVASAATSVLMIAPSASASGSTSASASTSSVAAAAGACYRQNNWSFKHTTGITANTIDAWPNTTCSGRVALRGRVGYLSSSRHVSLYAYDLKADNYGVTLYTHGPSVSASGNGDTTTGGGNLSSFQTPYNFWIRVGNQQNSVSMPFPL